MKRSVVLYSLLAVITAVVVIKTFQNKHKAKQLMMPRVEVALPADGYLVRDTLLTIPLNTVGSLLANEAVDIQSELSLRLASIHFQEGEIVSRGQLLFKLDDAAIQATLRKLQVDKELAAQNEARSRAMLGTGGISQQVYDEALHNLNRILAEIAIQEVELHKTEIRTPFRGRIGLRNVSVGAYLHPGMTLATILDINKIKIDFTLPERYASIVSPGQVVYFNLPDRTNTYSASIEATQPGIDPRTRNLQIRAACPNPGGTLIPGTSVLVTLQPTSDTANIYIPSQCLVPAPKGYFVYALVGGVATIKPVTTGERTSNYVQILEGIALGDTLVMTNLLRMKPGKKINLSNTY